MTESFQNFIDGEWVAGVDQRPNINPSDTADVIGLYASASEEQAQAAVAAARRAFHDWSRGNIQARHDSLQFVARELMARREEIGELREGIEGMEDLEALIGSGKVEIEVDETKNVVGGIVRRSRTYDLTMVGASREGWWHKLVAGTVPERVLRRSTGRLLLVKHRRSVVRSRVLDLIDFFR